MSAYNPEKNKMSLEAELALNEAAKAAIHDYIGRSGLSVALFASRIGYSNRTMKAMLGGYYHEVAGSAHNIRKAAYDFMQQNPVQAPTTVNGDLYDTANVRLIQRTFEKLLPKPVAYMIYAPPGSQKTFALQNQVAAFNCRELAKNGHGRRAYYVYARQGIKPRALMKRVTAACGAAGANDIDQILNALRWEFRHRRVLLIVDEAQHLSLDCFEVLRELLDQPPFFSLLFAGSHDLKQIFDRFSATLEQWNSRIIDKVRLPGLEREEAEGIIRRELGPVLPRLKPAEVAGLMKDVVARATTRDVFEKNRHYINVRTLTNELDAIKQKAGIAVEAAHG